MSVFRKPTWVWMCCVRQSLEWEKQVVIGWKLTPKLTDSVIQSLCFLAVFVLSTLQQLDPVDGQTSVLVICHTRELA